MHFSRSDLRTGGSSKAIRLFFQTYIVPHARNVWVQPVAQARAAGSCRWAVSSFTYSGMQQVAELGAT